MVSIKVFSYLFTFLAAHELVAPGYYYDGEKDYYELNHMVQLHGMFHGSKGIAMDLPDGAFTATDQNTDNQAAIYSRIGAPMVEGKKWAWCGAAGQANEITVDLTSSYLVMGVATQGRGDYDAWTTKYSVETSEDGNYWVAHGSFLGNFDRNTICRRRLEKPKLAGFVKFTALEYYHTIPCMRLDVLVHSTIDN